MFANLNFYGVKTKENRHHIQQVLHKEEIDFGWERFSKDVS